MPIAALRASSQINSIYLSDIYEEIIHHFSHVGFVLTVCVTVGGMETVDLQHIDSKSFPSQHGTPECPPTSQTLV